MQCRTHRQRRARFGLSNVEVIVATCLVGLLIVMVPPALQRTTTCGRRMECQNNLKNIALATLNYASANQGRMPLLEDGRFGWPVTLLPYLDSAALHRTLMADPLAISRTPPPPGAAVLIKVLACPQDLLNSRQHVGLSYVANAGWGHFRINSPTEEVFEIRPHSADVDWDRDGIVNDDERRLTRATGIFWRAHEDRFQLTLDDVNDGDGQAATMLFTENTNARNWLSRETLDIGFVVGLDRITFEPSPDGRLGLNVTSANLGPFAIRSAPRMLPGRSPVPSSNHAGVFNVAYVDGRAVQLNVNIDPRVYLAQMTWNGGRYGEDPKHQSEP